MTDRFTDAETALRALYAARPGVLAYARAICGDPLLADEAFQEVAALAVRKHAAIEVARMPAWARSAVRFAVLDLLRQRRRAARPLAPEVMERLEAEWSEDEDAAAAGDARLRALRTCLGQLDDPARGLLDRRYRDGLDGAGLAQALGLSENAVWQRLGRLHRRLAECMRKRLAGGLHA